MRAASKMVAAVSALLLLLAFGGLAAAYSNPVIVRNDNELYNAFINQGVDWIGLAYDGASLAPYSANILKYTATSGPFPVQRSLTIEGSSPTGSPQQRAFDFAYIGGVVALARGNTFTLRGLSLSRMQALRAPVGLFSSSEGATVRVENCVNNQQVCWPHEAANVYFLQVFQRPDGQAQQATICAPGTETSCSQYTFTNVGFRVNRSPEFNTGGYDMYYINTVINCLSYANPLPSCPTLLTDLSTNPYNCLATVYDPANFATICPTCTCINGCRQSCNSQGRPQPSC
ncbi:hypothetical protein GPECTOR_5g275 [Gonium pectorale]|uniref:Pherophorin domain-containing protein n=1 Tax=Gonium pectorale TaxID=33097 RepID=A0A150GWK3_GONPE|nr:hypothetical protein GPECTOR_5g275 [Gonium pectorale]|eukprot:KXZ54179.1 hypothetical protein GPECTOR_5g275 [Gonium pectorale]